MAFCSTNANKEGMQIDYVDTSSIPNAFMFLIFMDINFVS